VNTRRDADKQAKYLKALADAKHMGVKAACQLAGISRTTFYKKLQQYERTKTVQDQSRARKNPPALDQRTIKAIARCRTANPSWGAKRISADLKRRAVRVSASAIERLWKRERRAEAAEKEAWETMFREWHRR
jgi:transposase